MSLEHVKSKLKQLRLASALEEIDELLRESEEHDMSYLKFLDCFLETEMIGRESKRIARKIKQAQFPIQKTLADFDFSKRTDINKHQIVSLCDGQFIRDKENLIFIGNPGLGKTHLAIAIAYELCQKDFKVLFTTATALVNRLREARDEKELTRYFKTARTYDLIVIDEIGYFPFEKDASELVFQYFSERYERGSVIVTSNLPFSKWNEIFYTERLTTALLDRLIHHSTIIEFSGDSYRFNQSLNNKKKTTKQKKMEVIG